jgi:hypothetical protein
LKYRDIYSLRWVFSWSARLSSWLDCVFYDASARWTLDVIGKVTVPDVTNAVAFAPNGKRVLGPT